MMKEIERSSNYKYYVVEVNKDNVQKYVAMSFPGLWECTVKLNKAKRFTTEAEAQQFIDTFSHGYAYLKSAVIVPVTRTLVVG